MKRDIYQSLCDWKVGRNRRPLLIRGARQTGKTYIINEFGVKEYNRLITINFERNPEYKDIFNTYDPIDILEKISLYTGGISGYNLVPAKAGIGVEDCFNGFWECSSAGRATAF